MFAFFKKEWIMEERFGKTFMEKTKFQNLDTSDQMKGLPSPALEWGIVPDQKKIDLPKPESLSLPDIGLRTAIDKRQSIRQYSTVPITREELSFLLWCTQGVKQVFPDSVSIRTVPSAGARHALETYILVNRVKKLDPGLYRFLAIDHKLVQINRTADIAEHVTSACLGQYFVMECAAVFIWIAVISRMTWRYGERGYRYIFLDAGHVCQNLYLSAEALGCGVCAIGAFSDDELNSILKLDGEQQFVIYLATVGKQ